MAEKSEREKRRDALLHGAPEPHRGPGGPSLYRPEYAERAQALCINGATNEDLAREFKVTTVTIRNWSLRHFEFLCALNIGKKGPDDQVERALYNRAIGYNYRSVKIFMPAGALKPVIVPYIEHVPPDTTAQIYWLKNRRPAEWRDRKEITGPDGAPMQIDVNTKMTIKEAADAFAQMVED